MEEIVARLNLFAGQLSLTDILETPIPMLDQLEKAKFKFIEKQEKAAKKSAQGTTITTGAQI